MQRCNKRKLAFLCHCFTWTTTVYFIPIYVFFISYLLSLFVRRQYRKTENKWMERDWGDKKCPPARIKATRPPGCPISHMWVLTLIYQEVIKQETLLRKTKMQTFHSIHHTNAKKQKTGFGKVLFNFFQNKGYGTHCANTWYFTHPSTGSNNVVFCVKFPN